MYQRGVPCDVVSTRTSPGLSAVAVLHPADGRAGRDAGASVVVVVDSGWFLDGFPDASDELEQAAVARASNTMSGMTGMTDTERAGGRRTGRTLRDPPRARAMAESRLDHDD
jgi:hypothetical protein